MILLPILFTGFLLFTGLWLLIPIVWVVYFSMQSGEAKAHQIIDEAPAGSKTGFAAGVGYYLLVAVLGAVILFIILGMGLAVLGL